MAYRKMGSTRPDEDDVHSIHEIEEEEVESEIEPEEVVEEGKSWLSLPVIIAIIILLCLGGLLYWWYTKRSIPPPIQPQQYVEEKTPSPQKTYSPNLKARFTDGS
jgi:hypothetical protein